MVNSREKGKRGERDAARCVQEVLGMQSRRGLQYRGGPDSPDVIVDGLGLHFEVKYTSRLRLYDAMDQAITDSCRPMPDIRYAAADRVPVVLHRRPGECWLWIQRLSDTMAVYEELRQARNTRAFQIATDDGGDSERSTIK